MIDWPSRDIPESLARAGLGVTTVRGGPGPAAYSRYGVAADQVVVRPTGKPPAHVDLVYCHRPVDELPGIVEQAKALGALAVWRQSGLSADGVTDPAGTWVPAQESRQARAIAEGAGVSYIEAPYIVDAIRDVR